MSLLHRQLVGELEPVRLRPMPGAILAIWSPVVGSKVDRYPVPI